MCGVPAQLPGTGLPGHPVRGMCPPQGPDLGLASPQPAKEWRGGGGDQEALCAVKGAPYVVSGVRRPPDQPPSGKEDNMPGIA